MLHRIAAPLIWCTLLCAPLRAQPHELPNYVNAQLPWHPAVVDTQGKLLAWFDPGKNLGYDKVLRLGWDFIEHKIPRDARHHTGLKIYLINSVFEDGMRRPVSGRDAVSSH